MSRLAKACACAAIAAVATAPTTTQAGDVQVIFTTINGHPTAAIPDRPGLQFRNFWRPYRSPNGKHWCMRANKDFFDSGSLLLVGSGNEAEADLVFDDAAPFAPSETINGIDHQMGILDDGTFAFGTVTAGGDQNANRYIIRHAGSTYEVIAVEGDAVPGLPGATYGSLSEETHILDSGTVGFLYINCLGLPSDSDTIAFLGDTIVAREKVTIPSGQAVGGMQPWDFFAFDGYYHSSDGSHTLLIGDLEGSTATDGVVVVDGIVRIQEGSLLPGLVSPVGEGFTGLREGIMISSGDWFAHGGNADGNDWVVRNGAVIALTDLPVATGSSEHYSDAVPFTQTFFMMAGNNLGDYVVGGTTDNADDDLDSVVVLNGTEVVLRENTPIDLDGNGAFDDDVLLGEFESDESFLTDDLALYFNANLRNAAGDDKGVAFLRICLGPDLAADLNRDCAVDLDDYDVLESCLTGPGGGVPGGCADANFNNDADINLQDYALFQQLFVEG